MAQTVFFVDGDSNLISIDSQRLAVEGQSYKPEVVDQNVDFFSIVKKGRMVKIYASNKMVNWKKNSKSE